MINHKPKELAPILLVDGLIFLSAYFPLFAILLIQDFRPKAVEPNRFYRVFVHSDETKQAVEKAAKESGLKESGLNFDVVVNSNMFVTQ